VSRTATRLLRLWLRDRAQALRSDAKDARAAYTNGDMLEACTRIADVHDAAAALYEAELAKLGSEAP
jgi:hypothetical protein